MRVAVGVSQLVSPSSVTPPPPHLRDRRGSPAHAGIDRIAAALSLLETGFPRTRGDRPGGSTQRGIPPHTRG